MADDQPTPEEAEAVAPAVTPIVTLLTPNGGEVIPAGDQFEITWTAEATAAQFDLSFSQNNGDTWHPIVQGVEGTSYLWTVPATAPRRFVPSCWLRIVARDALGTRIGADRSNGYFKIEVIRVLTPAPGTVLHSGEPTTITWWTTPTPWVPVGYHKVLFSRDAGLHWKVLLSATHGDPGSIEWTPQVARERSRCVILVIQYDLSGRILGSDVSDGLFTIEP